MLEHRGEYPADWKAIAALVRLEAGERCVRCRHRNDAPYLHNEGVKAQDFYDRAPCDVHCTHPLDRRRRVLTVHHMDGDKSNCRWWNLLPLCQVCHLQVQAKVNPAQEYLWEHQPWMKPYVAGYYAWIRAGLELTRAEVEAALEHWLLLGQPHRMSSLPDATGGG